MTLQSTSERATRTEPLIQATGLLKKAAQLEAEVTRTKRLASEQREEIDAWERDQVESLTREIEGIRARLADIVLLEISDDPRRRRSISTPAGKAGFHAGSISLKVDDAEAALAFLQPPDGAERYVRRKVTTEVDVAALKAALVPPAQPGHWEVKLPTGEIVPGCHWLIQPDVFKLEAHA